MNSRLKATPVEQIASLDEITWIAESLFKVAAEHPVDESPYPHYAKTKEELAERLEENMKINKAMLEHGLTRRVLYQGKVINLVMSLDTFEGPPYWHLSISALSPLGPVLIPDEAAEKIAQCFFASGYEEMKNPTVQTGVRHFKKFQKQVQQ